MPPQFERLKAEFDALSKSLMLCICACRCGTCFAEAGQICRSKNGRTRSHHMSRIDAGHVLLGTSVESAADRMFKAMRREQPERIAAAIAKVTGATT